MKPVYLEMNYFGPHEHSIIDFRRLEEAPIFLIGGDTGAGKSTIFDAMTFALFANTTSDRDAKEMRSQFAPSDAKTSVIFYFEQGNNLYKIERTPEQWLEKKTKAKGLTLRKASATLGIVEKVGGPEIQSIASKSQDVGIEITDILKLSAEQFKKIILLPQNDFSDFLKAKTSDKKDILKRIFGTQIFTDFSNKLKDKYDKARQQNTDFETELKTQINSMNLTDEELENLGHEAENQKIVILKKFVDNRKNSLSKSQVEVKSTNKVLNEADKSLQKANEIKNKFDNLENLQKQYQANITDHKSIIDQKVQHTSELDWSDKYKDTVHDLKRIKKDNEKSLVAESEITSKLKITQENYNSVSKQLDKLIKEQPNIDHKNSRIDELSVLIPLVTNSEKINRNLSEIKPQIKSITTEINKKNDVSAKLNDDIKSKKDQLIEPTSLQKKRNSLLSEKENFVTILSPIENKQNNLNSEIKNLKEKISKQEKELKAKEDTLAIAKKDYHEKIGTRQSLMIAQLQQELVPGEPCVVCGSTEHPQITKTVEADEVELKKSIDAVDKSQKNYAAAEQNIKSAQNNLEIINNELSQKNIELDSINKSLKSAYLKLTKSSASNLPEEFNMKLIKEIFDEEVDKIDSDLEKTSKLSKEISTLENSLKENDQLISENKLKLTEVNSQQATYKKDLKDIEQQISNNDKASSELSEEQTNLKKAVVDYTKQLESSKNEAHISELALSSEQTKLNDISEQAKKQSDSIEKLQSLLDITLKSSDAKTTDINILIKWIDELNQGANSELKEAISSYNKEKELLTKDIQKNTTDLSDVKIPDIAQLTEDLKEKKSLNNAAMTKSAELNLIFDNANSTYSKIKKIINSQSDFGKRLAEITGLYNVITGKDGNDDKLKLETYVVQNYLRKVLDYANHTFINDLSNNRYSFEIAAQGSDKRTDHGLDINVYDNETGATRSSDTLSGGETFIAALSIALSLSEVVQSSANGVKIDALFIDEGFGSLDDETLEKAMSALENIGQNRMVGVISHIDAMKTTIGQQVLIKKIGDGRSTVKIITK
ncbi:AAA family ATPase [Companilactobacillus keshanensis]|uniref:Nuclease SbcCD subunit C n=1 Tax=Companilactobacillus keshanensis TaxID=2486003 RepID=A0ABW4BXA9_9LACO|nr:SMC family ATPase [Companilactobacillus keshanensis]